MRLKETYFIIWLCAIWFGCKKYEVEADLIITNATIWTANEIETYAKDNGNKR